MQNGIRFGLCDGRIYFITLQIFNEQLDLAYDTGTAFYTTDCIIERIEDADTGIEYDSVTATGIRNNAVTYRKNERITGEKTYYCKSIQDLIALGFCDLDCSGHYYIDAGTHARRIACISKGCDKLKEKASRYRQDRTGGKG